MAALSGRWKRGRREVSPGHTTKRRQAFVVGVTIGIVASVLFSGLAAHAILSGSPSNFESNDGDMVAGTNNHDWNNVINNAAYVHLSDTAASTGDDSFTPGQKQDTTCPSTDGHKNPPKDDFTDIASFTELATNGDTFLYGATIRYAANGNASENVELKQGTSGYCPGSTTLLARTPGDKLLAIDYLNGGTSVDFHVLTWIASGACFVSSDAAPCWGASVLTLGAAGAEGKASQSDITAANNKISNTFLNAGEFAEFGVNLRLAGIIPAGTCKSFAQTVWESRSSGSSFVSSTKDVTLEDKSITNCGEVVIIKHTNPRGINKVFNFTSNLAGSELTCTKTAATAFSLNDNGNTTANSAGNTQDCTNVPVGTFTVTEGANPTGFGFASLSCVGAGGATGVQNTTVPKQADITMTAGGKVTCTYVNNQLKGAIKITKTSSKGLNPGLAGAQFAITSGGTAIAGSPFTTNASGVICVDNLALNTYSVRETVAPTGYAIDDTTAHNVSVTANSTCGDGNEATFAATDTPLSDIQVRFRDGGSGATSATSITCDNTTGTGSDANTAGWDKTRTVTGVHAPTTIHCTIEVDP